MKILTEFYENLISSNIGVLAARPISGQTPLLTNILIKYGIEKNKKITIYTMDEAIDNFLTTNMLASLTNIPKKFLRKYIYPLKNCYQKLDNSISQKDYFANLEKLSNSKIEVINYDSTMISNPADFILEDEKNDPSDIIIIYAMETFIKNSESPRQFLKTIQNLKPEAKIIMTCGIEREVEGNSEYNLEDIHNYHEIRAFTDAIALLKLSDFTSQNEKYKTIVHFKGEEFFFTFDRETNRLGE